jgi:hypothetical protein
LCFPFTAVHFVLIAVAVYDRLQTRLVHRFSSKRIKQTNCLMIYLHTSTYLSFSVSVVACKHSSTTRLGTSVLF